jgi:hypothetical protein
LKQLTEVARLARLQPESQKTTQTYERSQKITMYSRRRILLLLSTCCAVAGATATPALSAPVQPALSPGNGGSPVVTNEGSVSTTHTFGELPSPGATTPGSKAGPDLEGACRAYSQFVGKEYVGGKVTGKCAPAKDQQVEICVEQYYGSRWYSSETCNTSALEYTTTLPIEAARSLLCTHGRKYRVWNWYYTPGGEPEVTTGLYPDSEGETRC